MHFKEFVNQMKHGNPKPGSVIKTNLVMSLWTLFIIYGLWTEPLAYSLGFYLLFALCLSSAFVLWQKQVWGKRLAQASVVVFCIVTSALWLVGPSLVLKDRGDPDPFMSPFTMFFAASIFFQFIFILTPSFYGLKYLNRITEDSFEIKREQDDFDYRGTPKEYTASLLPFGHQANMPVLFIGLMTCFEIVMTVLENVPMDGSEFIMIPFFVGLVIALLGGPFLYNQLQSPFSKGRQEIASFTGSPSNFFWNSSPGSTKIILYDDGLEVRSNFARYFLPYHRISDIECDRAILSNRVIIRSDLPKVPNSIAINTSLAEEIVILVRRAQEKQAKESLTTFEQASSDSPIQETSKADTEHELGRELLAYKREITQEINDKKAKAEKEINKKYFKIGAMIFTLELLILLSTGPGMIIYKYFFGTNDRTEIHGKSYEPIAPKYAPDSWMLVEVIKDNEGNVQAEKYYRLSAEINTVQFHDGGLVTKNTFNADIMVIGFFAFMGIILGWMSTLKEELIAYAISIFMWAFVFGLVFVFRS